MDDKEVSKLRSLYEVSAIGMRLNAHSSLISRQIMTIAEQYDERTINLYHFLHEHGDERTRKTIEDMNIIGKLTDTGYDDPGYEDSPLNK